MNERELLVDCLRRLNRTGIVYYLTGSMQLPTPAMTRIVAEFSDDFYIDEEAVRAAQEPPYQFNAVDTRSALKVDFWLVRPEPFDQEMLRRRLRVALFGEPAWIATAEDVILHKLIWNRLSPSGRQLGDAAGVVAVQADALDKAYLRQWSNELGVAANLERLLSGEIKPKNT
jgi:hypothetical protein